VATGVELGSEEGEASARTRKGAGPDAGTPAVRSSGTALTANATSRPAAMMPRARDRRTG